MSKALVIKSADFSANKVTTVTFEGVHTTGISISSATMTLSSIGGTQTLTATVTPADSVDAVVWSSSDETVATVASGTVTAVGIGSCTITVTSGSYSAQCTVTVSVVLSGTAHPKTLIDPAGSANNAFTRAICDIGIASTAYSAYLSVLDADQIFGDNLLCGSMAANVAESGYDYQIIAPGDFTEGTGMKRMYDNIGYPVPMKIPTGTTTLRCTGLSAQYGSHALFFDSTQRANSVNTDANGGQYYCAFRQKYTPKADDYTWVYQQTIDVAVPDGYDAVVVVWKTNPDDETAVLPENMTAEQLAQFTVTCL